MTWALLTLEQETLEQERFAVAEEHLLLATPDTIGADTSGTATDANFETSVLALGDLIQPSEILS
jgi:hypothetical protein